MKLVSSQSKNDKLFARVAAAPGTSNCVGTTTNAGCVGTSTSVNCPVLETIEAA